MEILYKKPFLIVGYRIETNWSNLFLEIPRTWKKLYHQSTKIKNKIDNRFFEISLEKKDEIYTEILCAEVSEIESIPEGMIGMTIPAQSYVNNKHYGSHNKIVDSFREMYSWAKENGYSTGHFKIDYGYFQKEKEPIDHSLYIKIEI